MNLNQLRVFAAVADHGSFTEAARALAVSQPAVSKQLSELEASFGLRLVERLPRGARLTDAGRVLHEHAARIFASEAAAEADLAALAGLARGRLRVGASTTIGSYLMPSLFGQFHRAHPSVSLELQIANTEGILRALLAGELDLALTEGIVPSATLQVEVAHHDEIVVIVAPSHPWASRRHIALAKLGEVPFIARERGSGTRDVIEAAFAERGLTIEPMMALGGTEAVKSAVAAGLGVAMVSRLTVELELASGHLVALDTNPPVRRALHLLTQPDRRPGPAAAAFLELLRAPGSRLRELQ